MHPPKKIWATVIALGVVALSVRLQVTRSNRDATRALADLAIQRRALETQVRRAQLDLENDERARLSAALPSAPATPASAVAGQPSSPRPKSDGELIASAPRLQLLSLKSDRARAELESGSLSRALGLSPDKIKKLQEIGLKYSELHLDLNAIGDSQSAADPFTIATLRQEAFASLEAAQLELLGQEGYQQFQAYIRTLGLRDGLVRDLAVAASLEDIPIAAEQGRQLLQAAWEAGTDDPKSDDVGAIIGTIDWVALDRQAQKILTPAQFALFLQSAAPGGAGARATSQFKAAIRRARKADAAAGLELSSPASAKP